MIGYHYSPIENRMSIAKHGLLVPTLHPRLTTPVTCSSGHRNPHISLARNPVDAWELSGGFLEMCLLQKREGYVDMPLVWDLWQVQLGTRYKAYGEELQSSKDIARHLVARVGQRRAERAEKVSYQNRLAKELMKVNIV